MTKRNPSDVRRFKAVFYTTEQMLELLHLKAETELAAMVDGNPGLPVPVDVGGRPMWLITEVERWARRLEGYALEIG